MLIFYIELLEQLFKNTYICSRFENAFLAQLVEQFIRNE